MSIHQVKNTEKLWWRRMSIDWRGTLIWNEPLIPEPAIRHLKVYRTPWPLSRAKPNKDQVSICCNKRKASMNCKNKKMAWREEDLARESDQYFRPGEHWGWHGEDLTSGNSLRSETPDYSENMTFESWAAGEAVDVIAINLWALQVESSTWFALKWRTLEGDFLMINIHNIHPWVARHSPSLVEFMV